MKENIHQIFLGPENSKNAHGADCVADYNPVFTCHEHSLSEIRHHFAMSLSLGQMFAQPLIFLSTS